MRILKRIKRRLIRFFRPAARFFGQMLRRLAAPRVAAVKAEGQRFREGVTIAKDQIGQAKRQGAFHAFGAFFCAAGKSFSRHRRIFVRVVNIAAPIVGIFVLLFTVQFWNNRDFGLLLHQDGEAIAVLRDEQTFEQAEEMVNVRKVTQTLAAQTTSLTPRYTLAVTNAGHFASPSVLCDTLIAGSGDPIEEATGLYINGELIGALKSEADLNYLLQVKLSAARGDDYAAQTFFVQDVDMVDGLYPSEYVMPSSAMKEIINAVTQDEAYYTVEPGDTLSGIAVSSEMSLSELNELNPGVVPEQIRDGDLIKIQKEKPFLTVKVVRQEEYQAAVPYATEATQNDEEFTDYSLVTQEGVDGQEHCVDRVTYIEGVETARENVSRSITQEPVNKQVIVGTKKRPLEGWATGEMVWPLPYTHNITSGFGARWGTMHKGFDISAGGAYGKPIVAADGGTVQYVKYLGTGYGYHLAIDHGNGIVTLYAHTSAIYVTAGQKVAKGQTIAAVGNTGDSSGPHLHFEVLIGGRVVSPGGYIS